jgi:hypothetical protein
MVLGKTVCSEYKIATTYNLKGSTMAIPTTPTTRTHARAVNSKYQNGASIYLSLKDRWNEVLASMPVDQKNSVNTRLKLAIKAFEQKYPNVKSFDDPNFRLCRAIRRKLSRILVDTTIQRQLNVDWVLKIIEHFVAYQAMPVQVYHVPKSQVPGIYGPDDEFFASWDGQHTAIAFWIIATMIFGQDSDTVEIPVVEYDMQNRLECRTTFMSNNGKDGKKLLSPIDFITQQIYAVRLDGVVDTEWVAIEEKQQHLEAVDLFLTDSKFFDDNEAGAIARPGDIAKEDVTPEMVRQFAVYANTVLSVHPRPINTKELPIILGFLRMSSNMDYTDAEVESLAHMCISLFGAEFKEDGVYWDRVGSAYTKWHERYHADMDESLRPGVKLNKDWAQGGTFFWHQLAKSWKDDAGNPMRLPRLNISTSFSPAKKDLF